MLLLRRQDMVVLATNLETLRAKASGVGTASHVGSPTRGKLFLSLKMTIATKPLATSVVATIIRLRNAGPQGT
jgi:hypothetical protein